MINTSLTNQIPTKAQNAILEETIQRDLITARRAALLSLIWQERYLTREALIARTDMIIGQDSFGVSAWDDTFYRDMRVVKSAFQAAGYELAYSRLKDRPGYYLSGQSVVHADLRAAIHGSIAELDPNQLEIYRQLTPRERFQQGCSTSDTARRVVDFQKTVIKKNER